MPSAARERDWLSCGMAASNKWRVGKLVDPEPRPTVPNSDNIMYDGKRQEGSWMILPKNVGAELPSPAKVCLRHGNRHIYARSLGSR